VCHSVLCRIRYRLSIDFTRLAGNGRLRFGPDTAHGKLVNSSHCFDDLPAFDGFTVLSALPCKQTTSARCCYWLTFTRSPNSRGIWRAWNMPRSALSLLRRHKEAA